MPRQESSVVRVAQVNGRRPAYLVWFCFWTSLAVFEAFIQILASRGEGIDRSWQRALAWNMPQFYLWMLLAPCISALGRRTSQSRWAGVLAVHVPASVLAAMAETVATLYGYWTWGGSYPTKPASLGELFRVEFVYQFHLAFVTYWIILAVLRELDSRRHLRDERLRSAQLQGELSQAQLYALRMQLQPHFLFNTLNAISALSLADPPVARTMISRLSDLLRLSLEESQAQRVPLSRELQFLECYLAIQKIRFQDRLAVKLDIADSVHAALVPHLILQPLVENALQHGLLPGHEGGTLHISIEREGANLRMRVEDDGQGLPPAGLIDGIGLGNTRARLLALGSGSLELRRRKGGGTCAEVLLPYEDESVP
jgi:two-component system, LytTR family, sensor kinase